VRPMLYNYIAAIGIAVQAAAAVGYAGWTADYYSLPALAAPLSSTRRETGTSFSST
jgi:hypothetical protein